jgi:hypothetical protein
MLNSVLFGWGKLVCGLRVVLGISLALSTRIIKSFWAHVYNLFSFPAVLPYFIPVFFHRFWQLFTDVGVWFYQSSTRPIVTSN